MKQYKVLQQWCRFLVTHKLVSVAALILIIGSSFASNLFTSRIFPVHAAGSFSAYTSAVLANQPAAYYHLDETTGTTASDVSGNNYNATYTGSFQSQTGIFGNGSDAAVQLAGDNGYISTANQSTPLAATTGNHDRTVELWFNTSQSNGNLFATGTAGHTSIFDISLVGGGGPGGCGSQASAGLYIRFWDDDLHLTGLNLADSQWHYVVVTVSNSGNTVNVFVDNKQPAGYVWNGSCYTPNAQAQPFSMPFPVNTTATPIGIGNSDWGSGFNGDMDEVAIYPTALTATQVAAHYTAGNAQGSFGVGSPRVLESRVGQSVIPAAIAAFTDSTASPSSSFTYTATVDWGDGATSGPSSTYVASQANDCVVLGSDIPGACFDIIANHAYVNTGVYTYKIVVTRSDGQTLDINGEAEVSPTNSDALTSYKYQARTGVLTWLKPDGSWFGCTATVIHSMSHDMLVTAAHCGIPQGNVTQLYFAPGFNTSGGICPFPVPSTNTENGVPILTKCPAADVPFGVWVGGKVLSNPAYNGDSTYGRSNDQSFVRLGGTHCPGNNTSLCDQKSVEDVVGADWMDFFYWQLNNSTPAPIRATTFGYPIDLGEPGVALSPPQSNWSESDVQNFAETLQLCANRKPVTALQIGNPPAPYFALENCSYNTGGLAAGVSGSPYLSNDGPLANAVAAVQQGLAPEYNRLDAYSGVPSLITALTYLQADTNP